MREFPCAQVRQDDEEERVRIARQDVPPAQRQCLRIFYGMCGFSTCRVDSESSVRILNSVCGFSAGRADFRQVVWIAHSLKPSGNGHFRVKNRRFRAHPAEKLHNESTQVLKNPHDQSRIHTGLQESTRPVQNPHGTSKKSARPVKNPHGSFSYAIDRTWPLHASCKRFEADGHPLPQLRDTGVSPG